MLHHEPAWSNLPSFDGRHNPACTRARPATLNVHPVNVGRFQLGIRTRVLKGRRGGACYRPAITLSSPRTEHYGKLTEEEKGLLRRKPIHCMRERRGPRFYRRAISSGCRARFRKGTRTPLCCLG